MKFPWRSRFRTVLPDFRILLSLLMFLAVILAIPGSGRCWDAVLMKAARDVAQGTATPRQQALVFKYNAEINQMRIKDARIPVTINGKQTSLHMSDEIYQVCQNQYAETNRKIAAEAAKKNGADMNVQTRSNSSAFDAGTDSDYITTAKSPGQVKKIINDYNKGVDDYLAQNDLASSPGRDHARLNDVDFMADPQGVSRSDFQEIANLNNDAYQRPEAAAFEAKVRSGQDPDFNEIMAYKDEMGDFVHKKNGQIRELTGELEDLTRQTKGRPESLEEFRRRMEMEARLQQTQAQKSKYMDRMQDATEALGRNQCAQPGPKSGLPGKSKKRAPSADVSQSGRQSASAAADSMSGQIIFNDKVNESALLAMAARNDPTNARNYQQRILDNAKNMGPAQKNELLMKIQGTGASEQFVKETAAAMRGPAPGAGSSQKTSEKGSSGKKRSGTTGTGKLGKLGQGAGIAGDVMGIADQLEKAEKGQHLFINHEADDSDTTRWLKNMAVAGLELLPIPVMDAMERGFQADLEEQAHIRSQIAKGEVPNPAGSLIRVTGKIVGGTISSMTLDPLMAGVEAVKEGAQTVGALFTNWKDQDILDRSLLDGHDRFEEMMARASRVDAGDIFARKESHDGRPLNGPVCDGDILALEVYPNITWTNDYFIEWEVTGPGNALLGRKKIPSAKDPGAGRFRFQCEGFEPGEYGIRFRIKGKTDNKQYALSKMGFKVEEPYFIALSEIMATLKDFGGEKINQEVAPGQVLAFEVKRKGTWTDKEMVEWLVNGEVYKEKPGGDPKSHCLRFDASPLPEGAYEVAVRTIKDDKIHQHKAFEFKIKGSKKKVPDAALAAYLDQINGTPLPEHVQNGQTLVFNAGIAFPESASPLSTVLDWQILDSNGSPVPGAGTQMRTYESGVKKAYPFKFTLQDFPNGRFQVRLIHYLAEDPEVFIEKRLGFNVFEPVSITGTRISDSPKGKSQLKNLYPDQDAYLFVYYDLARGIDAVDVDLAVREKETGKVIADMSQAGRPRKESGKDQRVGLFLDKAHMKIGKTFVFTAALSTPGTKVRTASGQFSVNHYTLDLKVPGTLKAGDFSIKFSILVPQRFERPFQVDVSGGTGLVIGHAKGALSGTISGITNSNASARLHVRVVDAKGRSADAEKTIALVPKAPPKPKAPVFPGSIKNLMVNARYFICPESVAGEMQTTGGYEDKACVKNFVRWKAENRFKYGKILYITLNCDMEEIFDSAAINRYDDHIEPGLFSDIELCFMPDGSFSHFKRGRYMYTLENGEIHVYYDEKGGDQIEKRWWNAWQ